MSDKKKLTKVLYLLSGILFFIAALINKNYVFIPIGCCFVALGIIYGSEKHNTNKKDKNNC